MNINREYVLDKAKALLSHDSPSGFTFQMMKEVETWVQSLGYKFESTKKGGGIITVPGQSDYTVGLCAHIDTLGAMVRSISSDGTLKFTLVGGPIVPTLDSEYCKIYTRDGKIYEGTFICEEAAAHVHDGASSAVRKTDNMMVRIDEVVKSKEDVEKLGIEVGNFICIDPKTTITDSGFIKSRFIDDKGSVAALFGLMEYWKREGITPAHNVKILVSTYEEVGHGSSYIPEDIDELIAVDMGCIGKDLSCTEYDVSICAKDSSGPYDYHMVNKFIELAKANDIDFAVDIYPYYGSDVTAALRAGNNIRGGLIGPGVHASHGMERTHYDAVENTIKLLILYIEDIA